MGSRAWCPPAPGNPQQEHPNHTGSLIRQRRGTAWGDPARSKKACSRAQHLGQADRANRAGQRAGHHLQGTHRAVTLDKRHKCVPCLGSTPICPGQVTDPWEEGRAGQPSSSLSFFSSAQASDSTGPVPDASPSPSQARCKGP